MLPNDDDKNRSKYIQDTMQDLVSGIHLHHQISDQLSLEIYQTSRDDTPPKTCYAIFRIAGISIRTILSGSIAGCQLFLGFQGIKSI